MTKAQLQARVTELELAIRHANNWLEMGEGIDLLYYVNYIFVPSTKEGESFKIIDELINAKS